jgi:hypothetical protein
MNASALRLPIAVASLAIVLAACSSGGSGGGTSSGSTSFGSLTAAPPAADKSAGSSSQSSSSSDPILQAQGNRQVIRDATLGLRIKSGSFWDVYNQALAVADRFGGYLVSSHAGDPGAQRVDSGTIVLRVPSQDYDEALRTLRALGSPDQLQVTSQDVSDEYVDLQARLRNQQAQQAVLLNLMKRAQTIPDSIAVQNQLSQVTQEIERIEGRIRFLDQRTSYSTITLNLFVQAPSPVQPNVLETSGLAGAVRSAGQAFASVVGGMIVATGFLLPFLLLVAAGFGIWRALPPGMRPSIRRSAV